MRLRTTQMKASIFYLPIKQIIHQPLATYLSCYNLITRLLVLSQLDGRLMLRFLTSWFNTFEPVAADFVFRFQ